MAWTVRNPSAEFTGGKSLGCLRSWVLEDVGREKVERPSTGRAI
jgi:hypothetical protein